LTAKLCETAAANPYWLFPACDALIVQVPTSTRVTVLPETVQTGVVVDAKLTGSPELAVALIPNGAAPYVLAGSVPKVMV
jgi:hypothetical protein